MSEANDKPKTKKCKKTHFCAKGEDTKINPLATNTPNAAVHVPTNLPDWVRPNDPSMNSSSIYDTNWIYFILRCWKGGGVRYGKDNVILFDHDENAPVIALNERLPVAIVNKILGFNRYGQNILWRVNTRFVCEVKNVEYWLRPLYQRHTSSQRNICSYFCKN